MKDLNMFMFDTIQVAKGDAFSFDLLDITKHTPLSNIKLTVKWDQGSHINADADLVAVLLRGEDARPKAVSDLIYYHNTKQPGVSLVDSRNAGEPETLSIALDALPADVSAVAIYAVVYSVQNPNMKFGDFRNPALMIINEDSNEVTHQLNLQAAPDSDTFYVGTFYYQDGWKFKTSGENSALGMNAIRLIGNDHIQNSFKP